MTGYTKNLATFSTLANKSVGGKGASLVKLLSAGFPVPFGFVILTKAFNEVIKDRKLKLFISNEIKRVNINDYESLLKTSENIQNAILAQPIPNNITSEILNAYKTLQVDAVAVRSSATIEDSVTASWSGKLETYLNTDYITLLNNIRKCWASLFGPSAILYGYKKGVSISQVSVAVIIQKMIEAEVSGVTFTVEPERGDWNVMLIEAGWGLGEAVVGGQIIPDRYLVDKNDGVIIDTSIARQEKMLIKNGQEPPFSTIWSDVLLERQLKQKLTGKQICELANLCKKVELYFGFPCDIEWALANESFFLIQSRPITTL